MGETSELYAEITPLPPDFQDADAAAVEALGAVWGERVDELKTSNALKQFNEQLYRRWAIETGILERLYSIDRGVTQILVERGLDVSLIEHGSTDRPAEEVVAILRDHRHAVQYVMDFVAGDGRLSLHFIRSLHQILTAHQIYTDGIDQFGQAVKFELIRGDWKKLPNNPTRPDGSIHQYCPPYLVQPEMERLISFYEEIDNGSVPAVIRGAWLHHRFTRIHPFQDGNGRVARALSAFVFVQDKLFPIVVDRDDRSAYIDALEQADAGNLHPLVTMWSRLQKDAIESALSISDSVLSDESDAPNTLLRAKLLDALTDRAQQRREVLRSKQKTVLALGDRVFEEIIAAKVQELTAQLQQALRQIDPGFNCTYQFSNQTNSHWFKLQLVQLADSYKYYCDLQTYHRWARLKIHQHQGPESEASEIVLSLHSLGRNFSGVLALSGYIAEREITDLGTSTSGPPRRLSDRPLSFTYAEEFSDLEGRARDWVDMALNVALEEFRREI